MIFHFDMTIGQSFYGRRKNLHSKSRTVVSLVKSLVGYLRTPGMVFITKPRQYTSRLEWSVLIFLIEDILDPLV